TNSNPKILNNDVETLQNWCSNDIDFDLLFCPININKKHWSLITFDCVSQTVNNYDSLYSPSLKLVESTSKVLGRVFTKLKSVSSWKVNVAKDFPMQNKNSNDCGVFICCFAKSLAFNKAFDFSQSTMLSIRKNMQDDILNFCLD
ncbi:Ulp1 protease C-terminal catalytic domain-containing, partial [Brachionus plicatilis]